jgi:AraC-like DNA-binding protein
MSKPGEKFGCFAVYADQLYLTPKYFSKVIKDNSGASASEWIDNYVILEAKALLKSTNMTILQISDELNFPSQSFFGKYFKRVVGVSPKEYRESKMQ